MSLVAPVPALQLIRAFRKVVKRLLMPGGSSVMLTGLAPMSFWGGGRGEGGGGRGGQRLKNLENLH